MSNVKGPLTVSVSLSDLEDPHCDQDPSFRVIGMISSGGDFTYEFCLPPANALAILDKAQQTSVLRMLARLTDNPVPNVSTGCSRGCLIDPWIGSYECECGGYNAEREQENDPAEIEGPSLTYATDFDVLDLRAKQKMADDFEKGFKAYFAAKRRGAK